MYLFIFQFTAAKLYVIIFTESNRGEIVKIINRQLFKDIFEDSVWKERILEALISQILNEPIRKLKYISDINCADGVLVEANNSYINIQFNSNNYNANKRMQNFIFFSSIYSDIAKIDKKYIQINLNYGNIRNLNTNAGIVKYYWQTNDLEKLVSNITIIDVNVDNLRIECLNGDKNEYDYRYVLMFDLDKEELEKYYPNDEIKEEFFKLIMLKNEDFWIDPKEDQEKLINTERRINFSKGLKQGIEQGSDEKTINVIKSAISEGISTETIAKIVSLSTDEVKNIIEEHKHDKTSE